MRGGHAWHLDGDGPPVAVPSDLAELYRLDLWLNPHGFLKAARLPGANPVAFWRWEQLEKGRDGNVVSPEKVHVVAPAGRIAFQADLFDTHEPPRAAQLPAMRSLFNQVQRMDLEVATLAPVHRNPVPWSTFLAALQALTPVPAR